MKDCLMSLKIRKNKFSIFITLLLILALLTGLTAGYFSTHGITENGKFEAFSGKVFQNEVSGSTLTLHYTLAHPEKQGIRRKKASLGTVPTDMKNTYQICSQYEKKLKSFRYSRLSTENQLTLDSMLLYYHTEKSLGDNYLLQEPLGPSLGIQAQLPVLLADGGEKIEVVGDITIFIKGIFRQKNRKLSLNTKTWAKRLLKQIIVAQ